MKARAAVWLLVASGLWACPRWLKVATCHSDSDCESAHCGNDGICGVPPKTAAAVCGVCLGSMVGSSVVDGGTAFLPAHATTAASGPLVLMDALGAWWRVPPDGTPTRVATLLGPVAAAAPVVLPQQVALRALDGTLRLFSVTGDVTTVQMPDAGFPTSHQPLVAVTTGETALLLSPDDTGTLTVLSLGARPQSASLSAASGKTFAASCHNPGVVAVDGVGGLTLVRVFQTDAGAPEVERLLAVAETSGSEPPFPPVMVKQDTRVSIYSFRNLPDAVVTLVTTEMTDGGLQLVEPPSTLGLREPMSGTAAVTLVDGEPRVAVPLLQGTLRVVRREPDGLLSSERWRIPSRDGGAALGGVTAVRLDEHDPSATLLVGDADGMLHAFHDGEAVDPTSGWPFRLAGAVRDAPLIFTLPGRSTLSMLVTAGTSVVDIRNLRAVFFPGALVWPEYQHDAENSGCLDLGAP